MPSYKPSHMVRNLFWVWLHWLQELGGSYEPLVTEPSTKRTGRRDPDTKPRTYDLKDMYYHKDKRGILTKWQTRVKWGLRLGE